jgi:redox-regulated HSP33 family molecular chaperone
LLSVDLSPQAAQSLGELMVSSLMMGASLKNDESLQVAVMLRMQAKYRVTRMYVRSHYAGQSRGHWRDTAPDGGDGW